MIDLDALERAATDDAASDAVTLLRPVTVFALIRIARAAAVWTHARRVQAGTPVERSILADAVAIAVEQAGL